MRKATLLFASVPFALAFIACDKTPTSPLSVRSASRAVITNDHFDNVAFTFGNPCNGDNGTGTGKVHQVVSQTVDGNGGVHLNIKLQYSNVKLTAVSGASYVASLEVSENVNLTGGAQEETINQTTKIIGQGKTPNELVNVLIHITINANGDVTSDVIKASVECH